MKTSDWLTIAAIIIGPIAAWLLSHWMTVSKEKRDRKMNIFRTLMATRSPYLRLRLEHVSVLNTLPVEFDKNEKVQNAWNAYLFEMNSTQNDQELWRRRDERFFELLYEISKTIGYKHDKDFLKNTTYGPSGYGDEAEDWMKVRKWLAEVAEKNKPIPIQINEEPKTIPAKASK